MIQFPKASAMKIYTTGTTSFIATVAALVAYEERMQAFHISNKAIFWCGQGIIIIIMALFTYSTLGR